MRVLVIEPGNGSVWLNNAEYNGDFVVGEAWDDSQRGSPLLPDDYFGEPLTMNFPRSLILRVEDES
jgi:hypothetical protein